MPAEELVLVSTAYLAPVSYLSEIIESTTIIVEADENYNKQTIRNRCYIAAANGVQCLTVPVKKNPEIKTKIRYQRIDNSFPWQKNHIRSIKSAYGSAPYYDYFHEDLFKILLSDHNYLIDLNYELLNYLLEIILPKDLDTPDQIFNLDYDWSATLNCPDFRHLSDRKSPDKNYPTLQAYTQVFQEKMEFQKDLSALDLVFNHGKQSIKYLYQG